MLRGEGSRGSTRLGRDRGLAASDNLERGVRDADEPGHVVLIRVYATLGFVTGLGGVGVVRWRVIAGFRARAERNVRVESDPSACARSHLPFALRCARSVPSDLRHCNVFVRSLLPLPSGRSARGKPFEAVRFRVSGGNHEDNGFETRRFK